MKITHKQLISLIRESIDIDQSEAVKVMSLLTSDNVGSVKQGLELIDMLGIDPYEFRSDKQFFETLSYFLENEKPEMVKAHYYLKGGHYASIPAYLASKSLQESKALYDGITSAMDYKWMSDFKFKRHFDEIFYKGHREIRRLQIEHKDAEAYGMGDDYHEPMVDEEGGEEMSREEHAEQWMGEIEQQIESRIEVLNSEAHAAMNAITFYIDEAAQASFDLGY